MNSKQILKGIEDANAALKSQSLSLIDYGDVVTDEEIQSIEKQMGVKFCHDYMEFLRNIGCFHSISGNINGICYFNGGIDALVQTETERFNSEIVSTPRKEVTLLDDEDDGEWFVLLNHQTSKVLYYDPFASEWLEKGESLEDVIFRILDILKKP